jgi:hypothetical protein
MAASSWSELQFSEEQRRWLGIDANESLRVLATGSRTILLERTGGPSSTALPWDRDLVLSSDVRAFSLADVLHLLHASAKSGFLFFEHRDHAKSIYMHRGEVVFAASNQQVDRLGEVLLRVGVISPEQFREAKQAYTPTAKFGRILVERGFLSPRELWAGVKAQIEEIVRSLFSYGAGQVLFWEGEVRPDNVVRLSLPTRKLIAEGLRRRDELLKFLAWLEDPRVKLEALPGFDLAGSERAVFSAIAAGGGFAAICRRACVDPLSGARTLQLLRLLGAVKATREDEPEGDAPRGTAIGRGAPARVCRCTRAALRAVRSDRRGRGRREAARAAGEGGGRGGRAVSGAPDRSPRRLRGSHRPRSSGRTRHPVPRGTRARGPARLGRAGLLPRVRAAESPADLRTRGVHRRTRVAAR